MARAIWVSPEIALKNMAGGPADDDYIGVVTLDKVLISGEGEWDEVDHLVLAQAEEGKTFSVDAAQVAQLLREEGEEVENDPDYVNPYERFANDPGGALYARYVRCDLNYSWRRVARAFNQRYEGDWESNQIIGMRLCELAALALDENYMEPPWN